MIKFGRNFLVISEFISVIFIIASILGLESKSCKIFRSFIKILGWKLTNNRKKNW